MMKKIAHYISVIFHPLFIPLYTTFFIFNSYLFQNKQFAIIIYALLIVDSILLPYFFTRLINRKKQTSLTLESRRDRFWPVAFFIYSYAVLAVLFYYLKIGFYMELFFFSILGVSLITFILNFFYKVSLHMLAMGTVTGFLLVFFLLFKVYLINAIVLVVAVSAVVASARLILQTHSPLEIYSGYITGIVTTILVALWYYQFYMTHFTVY